MLVLTSNTIFVLTSTVVFIFSMPESHLFQQKTGDAIQLGIRKDIAFMGRKYPFVKKCSLPKRFACY